MFASVTKKFCEVQDVVMKEHATKACLHAVAVMRRLKRRMKRERVEACALSHV